LRGAPHLASEMWVCGVPHISLLRCGFAGCRFCLKDSARTQEHATDAQHHRHHPARSNRPAAARRPPLSMPSHLPRRRPLRLTRSSQRDPLLLPPRNPEAGHKPGRPQRSHQHLRVPVPGLPHRRPVRARRSHGPHRLQRHRSSPRRPPPLLPPTRPGQPQSLRTRHRPRSPEAREPEVRNPADHAKNLHPHRCPMSASSRPQQQRTSARIMPRSFRPERPQNASSRPERSGVEGSPHFDFGLHRCRWSFPNNKPGSPERTLLFRRLCTKTRRGGGRALHSSRRGAPGLDSETWDFAG
jgi:hypothetical protein